MPAGSETIAKDAGAPHRPVPVAAGCFGLSRAVEARMVAARARQDCPSLEQFEQRYLASEHA